MLPHGVLDNGSIGEIAAKIRAVEEGGGKSTVAAAHLLNARSLEEGESNPQDPRIVGLNQVLLIGR